MKLSYKSIALLVVITSSTIASCNKDKSTKDNSDQQFPKTLQYQGLTFTGTVRVFTYKGEITDSVVKAKAIISTGINLISHPNQALDPIAFNSKNMLQIVSDRFSLVEGNDDKLLFTNDAYSTISANETAVKFAPLYKYPGLQSSGNNFIYHSQLVLHGDYSAVKISRMDFCYLQRDANTNKIINRYVQWTSNEFNIKGINSLGERDTLAIREYTSNYTVIK